MTRNRSLAKAITWDWDQISSQEETTELYELSGQDVAILLACIETMTWTTRWYNRPGNFDLVTDLVGQMNERLMTPIDFCQQMANCIQEVNAGGGNLALQSALSKYLASQALPTGGLDTLVYQTEQGQGNVFDNLGGCDLDTIYGACVAIEDFIATVARDLVEKITGETLDSSRIIQAISNIPILSDLLGLDELGDWISTLVLQGITSFDAGYNSLIRQSNICALFESACADCTLTPTRIAATYAAQAGVPDINTMTARAIIGGLSLGAVPDEYFAMSIMALVASVLAMGQTVENLTGLPTLQQIARSGDPDSDWAIFCDPCANNPWCYVVQFGTLFDGTGDYTVVYGSLASDGVTSAQAPGFQQATVYAYGLDPNAVFTELSYSVFNATADGTGSSETYLALTSNGNVVWFSEVNNTIVGDRSETIAVPNISGVDTLRFQIRSPGNGQALIRSVTVAGNTLNPFTISNC